MYTQRTIALIVLSLVIVVAAAVAAAFLMLGPLWGAVIVASALIVILAMFFGIARPWYDRWGATDAEVDMALPGDDLVLDSASTTRAIAVRAGSRQVWPWLVQLGFGRAGWYSYDWIDNDGHPSADEILPEYQALAVGDHILMMPGMGFGVVEVDEGSSIVSMLDDGSISWCLALMDQPNGGCRLISRWRPKRRPFGLQSLLFLLLFDPGTFIMEQKMLRGIRDRAERIVATAEA